VTERTERILTTHTGSLPRPDDLLDLLYARDRGDPVDERAFAARVRTAVAETVRRQVAAGLDIVNDGEAGKIRYSTYVQDRLTGFGGDVEEEGRPSADVAEFPEWGEYQRRLHAVKDERRPKRAACIGPVSYRGQAALDQDLRNLAAAVDGSAPADIFLTAASPGVVAHFLPNRHYPSHEAYVGALAEAMKIEYDAIHRAGFVLQLDCPDLAAARHSRHADLTLDGFRKVVAINVEALNHATADIPPDRMRLHVCWGNYEGPHHHDVPLRDIVDLLLQARPAGLSVEAANPRHGHEWRVWEERALPDGKVLIPGVIDTTTNFIEHPELIAQRIVQYARVVGRDRVIAGTDCGFATVAGSTRVVPSIAWAKLQALVEGARLASAELWAARSSPVGVLVTLGPAADPGGELVGTDEEEPARLG
jgi:5-methyltetrahydropteroyltriglutamate--homocysteine methyltransferase